jgi:sugar-specific transcriptional regulator TrmB
MFDFNAIIGQLGYSPHEATVYLAALEIGSSTETDLAEHTKLLRTTVESILKSLREKGLMETYLNGGKKVWAAENPERLMSALREREATLAMALPQLHALARSESTVTHIRSYSGAEEMKLIADDILETKGHLYAVLSWDDWVQLLGESFLTNFIELRSRHYLKTFLTYPANKIINRKQRVLIPQNLLPKAFFMLIF